MRAKRPRRTCPICKTRFQVRYTKKQQTTCGAAVCKREYRFKISGPRVGAIMRAQYASGKRSPARGISPREIVLWPYLKPLGWAWRMKWWDAFGCFELDFCLPELKVAVEIDGDEHYHPKRKARDEARDAELGRRGWKVLRVRNEAVDASPERVIEQILAFAARV